VKEKGFAGEGTRATSARATQEDRSSTEVIRLPQAHDRAGIVAWTRQNPRALSTPSSLLFETDDLLCWRVIEALGLAAAAKEHLKRLRDDPGALTQYDFNLGELKETTKGKLARTALSVLDRP